MRFKEFLLIEQRAYLGQKVGDILTATQELRDDSKNMGSRDLTRFSEKIVNQIRRILHSQWPREEKKHLIHLQKIGVALMKSIEDKEDMPNVISSAAGELEKLSGKLGVPIHKITSPDKSESEPEEELKGTSGPEKKKSDTMPGAPPQPGGPPPPPPGGPPQDMQAPLGGSAGPLDAF
jgi:hypothetical protein